jgi:predicted regulator of Ras-like GTPase activity (Roadblock/LC7/MglB family)
MFNSGSSRYESNELARLASASSGARRLSATQRQQVAQLLGDLGYDVGAMLVAITDINGYLVSSWSRLNEIDADGVAMLSATSLVARLAMGELLGYTSSSMGVVQEHDNHTLFLLHIAADMAMVVVIEGPTRLGWVRVATRRVGEMIVDLLAADAGKHL